MTAQYININQGYTPEQLVQDIFIGENASDCLQISNISISGWSFEANEKSYGYFNQGNSNFFLEEGIILTTGKASSAIGPNSNILSEGPTNWLGDDDLEQALQIGGSINATVLEFDFIPQTNNISFDYVFASEQYLTSITSQNQCNYTDGFAFLLRRVNSNEPYQNLAVIPNTNTPVKVNTVRGQGVCPAANEEYFGGFNDFAHPTNYNGQTTVMTAQSEVIPGELYHIKLVIADQGNNLYDSAVFLKAGSFNGTIDLGLDRLVANDNPLCEGETFTLDGYMNGATSYVWKKDNEIIENQTSSQLTINSEGTYSLEVTIGDNCILTGEIKIEYFNNPILQTTTLVQCDDDNDGFSNFNLYQANSYIVDTPQDYYFQYFLTLEDAQQLTNVITNSSNYINTENNQTIFVLVENEFGCQSITEFYLSLSNNTLQTPPNLESCDDENTGSVVFDLTTHQNIISEFLPEGTPLSYYQSYQDALLSNNPIINPSEYIGVNNQEIYVKAGSNQDCFGIINFNLIVHSFEEDFELETIYLCKNSYVVLQAPDGYQNYIWNVDSENTGQGLSITEEGIYTVEFQNEFGCWSSKSYEVILSSRANILSIDIDDLNDSGISSIIVYVNGEGNYLYSIDGINFQNSPNFSNLPEGEYTVYIKDTNGCGTTQNSVFVLNYPKYFTPNGDGIHDKWRIPKMTLQYPNAYITIYDRYGKILYTFQGREEGWDGTVNGKMMPSTDYWFVIEIGSRTIKGHFSLKR